MHRKPTPDKFEKYKDWTEWSLNEEDDTKKPENLKFDG